MDWHPPAHLPHMLDKGNTSRIALLFWAREDNAKSTDGEVSLKETLEK